MSPPTRVSESRSSDPRSNCPFKIHSKLLFFFLERFCSSATSVLVTANDAHRLRFFSWSQSMRSVTQHPKAFQFGVHPSLLDPRILERRVSVTQRIPSLAGSFVVGCCLRAAFSHTSLGLNPRARKSQLARGLEVLEIPS